MAVGQLHWSAAKYAPLQEWALVNGIADCYLQVHCSPTFPTFRLLVVQVPWIDHTGMLVWLNRFILS